MYFMQVKSERHALMHLSGKANDLFKTRKAGVGGYRLPNIAQELDKR